MDMRDTVALVTGAGSGIGRATALRLAREGAAGVVADIDEEAGRETVRQIEAAGGRAAFVRADVASEADARAMVAFAEENFGGLDILVNNAGIAIGRPFLEAAAELWGRELDVNLRGVILGTHYGIHAMRKRGGGVIINTASVQGLQSMPLVPAYSASKGGDLSLTREMALDYAAENIRVLAICPGTIDTEIVRVLAREAGGDIEDRLVEFGEPHPLRRIGTGQDIANAVLFLASDKASFMTGSYVCVDGGLMAQGAWASGAGGQN